MKKNWWIPSKNEWRVLRFGGNVTRRTRRLVPMVILIASFTQASAEVTMVEELWALPTYEVLGPEKAPIFFSHESYQGASRVIYPYALNDVISSERVSHDWKVVTLENEFIKLGVTPEIGGKLYYATDKSNDYSFIYKNSVVKPGNLGMTGAWVSGGIEWCVAHHHRASTLLPVDYSLAEHADGSKTVHVGETEPRHGLRWTVGITVHPGKSYFEAEVTLHNQTPQTHSFLYWANVATHASNQYQTIFPPSVQHVTYHSKTDFAHWPVSKERYTWHDFSDGVDISRWKNVKNSASFFAHDLQEDFMGGYDHARHAGTVHIGDHNIVKGAKLWEWGSGPRGQATEGRLNEGSGPYVEIMVGAYSDNQPDYSWIRPYEVKRWKHYWYPIKGIGGFKNANLNAAVNLEQREKNQIFLGYHSTQRVDNARIVLRHGDDTILQKTISISPEQEFTELVTIDGDIQFTSLVTEMVDAESGQLIISYQPKDHKREALPEPYTPPLPPEDIATIEDLYLAGKRIEQFHNPRVSAVAYYAEALKRDRSDTRSNTALGEYHLRRGDLDRAKQHFETAVARLTQGYTRPASAETLYLLGLTLRAQGQYDKAVDFLYRSTWDYAWYSAAYLELAQISSMNGNWAKALAQIDESLSTNNRNSRAIGLKAALQRKLGDYKGAAATLANMPANDPLEFRIGNEAYLIEKQNGDSRQAETLLAALTTRMRDSDHNYLELADGYLDDGLIDEAENVLRRLASENPLIRYYLGYIQHKKDNVDAASEFFARARDMSVDYVFPYRARTRNVMETALTYNPNDAKAYYFLGNLLYDKQPERAIVHWEKAVAIDPDWALAHRNLGWGYYRHVQDLEKAIAFYERAIKLDSSEAIYYAELDSLYELNNSPISKRLSLFVDKNDVVRVRDDAFVRQIKVLTLAGQSDKAVEFLGDRSFNFREGDSAVREMIIDAQLLLGQSFFERRDYENALKHFLLAQIPDEEAGSARSGNRDIQVNYFIGQAYDALLRPDRAHDYYRQAAGTAAANGQGFMHYYKGLALMELGDVIAAREIFNSLLRSGNDALKPIDGGQGDFFAIFGERESENTRRSIAYTVRGLGYKGLGKPSLAEADLRAAVKLSFSNLWANTELQNL